VNAGGQLLVVCYFIAAFFIAFVVSAFVSVRSAARGDGLFKEWGKRSLAFLLTFFSLMAAYFAVGNVVLYFSR
jgi:hypothetical protein